MNKYLSALFLVTTLTLGLTSPIYAAGSNPKSFANDPEYAGKRCNTPAKGSNIIRGYFSGMEESPMASEDAYIPVDRFRCFTTMKQCKDWMYIMQSRYPNPTPRVTSCKTY